MMQPALFIQGQWRSGQGAQLNKTNPADNTMLWSALSADHNNVLSAGLVLLSCAPCPLRHWP